MHHLFPQSSKALRVFALILTCLFWVAAAAAQENPRNIELSAQPQTASQPQTTGAVGNPAAGETGPVPIGPASPKSTAEIQEPASTPATKSNESTANGSSDYKKTLNDLVALYEREVQKLEQQNNQAKELY